MKHLFLFWILFSYSICGSGQSNSIPSNQYVPPATTPQAPPPRTAQRRAQVRPPPPKPHAPPRTPWSLLPFSFLTFRMMQTQQEELKGGAIVGQIGLNLPASTYLYTSYSFRSSAASKGTTDLQGFGLNMILYTPQVYGFGFSGNYLTAGAGTQTFRSGPFYRFFHKWGTNVAIITPHLLFNSASSDVGRFVTLWSITFDSGFILTEGSVTYTWNNKLEPKTNTTTFDPAILVRIYQNIRLSLSYGHSKASTAEKATTNTGFGIDIREVF